MEEILKNNFDSESSVGVWHYIQVFCSFFSLIATFACILTVTEVRTNYMTLIIILWSLGVIAALLVTPGKLFTFAFSITAACASFGWFIVIFPFDLLTGLIGAMVGAFAGIAIVVVVPAVFTIYTYITELRFDGGDMKKELIVVFSGIGAVVAVIALFFVLNGVTKAVEVPAIQEKFDAVEVYNDYVNEEGIEKKYSDEVIGNPITSEFMDEGYVCENVYDFSGKEGNITFDYDVTMTFEYENGSWMVVDCVEAKEAIEIDPISGSWSGMGTYGGNLSSSNVYTCTFNNVTMEAGSGTFRIYLEGLLDEVRNFTVGKSEIQMEYNEETYEHDKPVMVMTLILDAPFAYEFFGVETSFAEIECKYYFADNVLHTDTITALTMQAN